MRTGWVCDSCGKTTCIGCEPSPEYGNPPEQWVECEACDGYGHIAKRVSVYEAGCGFPHDDTEEVMCESCNGAGGRIEEIQYDPPRP